MSQSSAPHNLVLIGYRGTGKTTVARRLAQRLGWSWLDADVELERRAGRTIAEIFATDGQTAFRDLESEILAGYGSLTHTVLATGGGVILREANRQRLAQLGRVVWLTARPETIAARLAQDAATASRRPRLTAQGGDDEIRRLLAEREPLYRACADFTLAADDQDPEQLAAAIQRHFFPESGPARTA